MKRCKTCGLDKPRTEYRPEPRNADGLMGSCRGCTGKRDRAYREANKDKKAAADKAYYEANRTREVATARAWAEAHPDRVRASQRRYYLVHQAGIMTQAHAYLREGQAETLRQARRSGYPWTGPELELTARTDLTAKQVALMTGRTLRAVYCARGRLRDDPKIIALAGLTERRSA